MLKKQVELPSKQHTNYVPNVLALRQGRIQGGAITSTRTYESNFIHHDFVQFGKQHLRYKAIFSSTVLSQHSCEVYFIS